MRSGFSLVGLKSAGEVKRLLDAFPEAWCELPYTLSAAFLEELSPVVKGRAASMHCLCPRRKFFPNFASTDPGVLEWSEKEMLKDAGRALSYGVDILVLHPGYLMDDLVPVDPSERIALAGSRLSKYAMRQEGSVCVPDYPERIEYREALERMFSRLGILSDTLAGEGLTLAVENLNPRSGYMFVHPGDLIRAAGETQLRFALDIGHLWMSAELFSLDFLRTLEDILATGRVVTSHLHSNPSDRAKGIYLDSHQGIDRHRLPWSCVAGMLKQAGVNMMLEVTEEHEHNLELLFSC